MNRICVCKLVTKNEKKHLLIKANNPDYIELLTVKSCVYLYKLRAFNKATNKHWRNFCNCFSFEH